IATHLSSPNRSESSHIPCPYLRRSLILRDVWPPSALRTLPRRFGRPLHKEAAPPQYPEPCASASSLLAGLRFSSRGPLGLSCRELHHHLRMLVVGVQGVASRRQPIARRCRAITKRSAHPLGLQAASFGGIQQNLRIGQRHSPQPHQIYPSLAQHRL